MKPPPILFNRLPGVTDYSQPENRAARAEQKLHDRVKSLPGYKQFALELEAGNPEAEALWIRVKKARQPNRGKATSPMKYVPYCKHTYPWEADPEACARQVAAILGKG